MQAPGDRSNITLTVAHQFPVYYADVLYHTYWQEIQMKSICVYCGSSDSVSPDYLSAAHEMGRVLVERGHRLIYGGGKTGLMGAIADGVLEGGGDVIGVITPSMNSSALAHKGVTSMDVVPDLHARKARMHQLSEGYIAMPGGFGTLDELFETITWSQVGEHQKPIGILNVNNYFAPLMGALNHSVQEGFIFKEHYDAIAYESDPEKILNAMKTYQHPHAAVKRWMREDI